MQQVSIPITIPIRIALDERVRSSLAAGESAEARAAIIRGLRSTAIPPRIALEPDGRMRGRIITVYLDPAEMRGLTDLRAIHACSLAHAARIALARGMPEAGVYDANEVLAEVMAALNSA